MDEIIVNGKKYILESETKKTQSEKGLNYVIVRTYSAGVFAGYLSKREGQEVTLLNARRLWYWEGASSLSQAAMSGFSKPEKCKFPCEVGEVLLLQAIEVLSCTQKAKDSIDSVAIWQS